MRAVVFAPLHNTGGKHDADEFHREAHAFCRTNGVADQVHLIDNRAPTNMRRDQVEARIEALPPRSLDVLAIFAHGWPTGLQTGHTLSTLPSLAKALSRAAVGPLSVVLYACSTAADDDGSDADERAPGPGGEGGFADCLRDALAAQNCPATIWAHTVRGHTTRNPYVRVFRPGHAVGGEWLVEPRSAGWPQWVSALRGERRFTFWRDFP